MFTFFLIIQIIVSVLLAVVIGAQQKGSGLSATFGGTGGFVASKRGAEKFLHLATIILGVIFIANSLVFIFI